MTTQEVYALSPEKLLHLLIANRWSQERIALEVETTQATISRIWSGKHKHPRHSTVDRLRQLVLRLEEFS